MPSLAAGELSLVFGGHLTFCEESCQLYLERFLSSEYDTEFSVVQCALHRGTTSPGLRRWGVTQGRNGEWHIPFSLSVRAGNTKVWPGQAVNSQALAEIRGAALQPLQAALPPCPRLFSVIGCHSLCNALLERQHGGLELWSGNCSG